MRVLGVDLGKHGGTALLDGDRLVHAAPMPVDALGLDIDAVLRLCERTDVVVIESPIPVRHGGGVDRGYSALEYQRGAWVASATAAGARVVTVPPSTWQAAVIKGVAPGQGTKTRACEVARRVGADLRPGRCRVDHSGVADAVCIALYGRAAEALRAIAAKDAAGAVARGATELGK